MPSTDRPSEQSEELDSLELHPDALMCALVLAPSTYARNRFFRLYERSDVARIRRRAARVRSIIRQLTGRGREPAQIVGEHVLEDRVLLRYVVESASYSRTTSLTSLEAALVHFALHRSLGSALDPRDKQLVEAAARRLGDSFLAEARNPTDSPSNAPSSPP